MVTFMSQDEQDAILGRTIRELRASKERLAMLRAEAKRRGTRVRDIGNCLSDYPEYLFRAGDVVDEKYKAHLQQWTDADMCSAASISDLTNAIRSELATVAELETRLAQMGHG